ncbi:EAL domain-containing protein [Cereibacter johrii]|uniref:Diguanylate cyclase/phosphodiesterase with PAS/PAC sensor(S) n=1 Tax=Cereibacter johrii TaxID=445629 RepID=A0ABX5J693_9RHOB|nr:EAL domain-containing protein [Cereibacter johrii]ODM43178.1 diguanylate cyclase [Cereibacter johrii]PTM78424.1 diguanylate cyclase/phosphodiesterase with PAS/PAC sensor(s) [Cereibacter johrii]
MIPHPPAVLAHRLSEGQRLATPLMRALMRATGTQVDAAIARTIAELGAHCGADRALVYRIEAGQMLDCTHEWCRSGASEIRSEMQRIPLRTLDRWMPILRRGEPIDVPDLHGLPESDPAKQQMARHGVRALVMMPLTDGTALIGAVGLSLFRARRPVGPAEMALLHSIAEAMGAALARRDAEHRAAAARSAARDVARNLERLARVTELMTNLVIVTDTEQQIVWVNRAFEVHTGHRLEAIRGRNFAEVVRGPRTDPGVSAAVAEAIRTCSSCEGETINYTAAGQPYWIRFNAHPLSDADGRYAGHASVETVITDRKLLERELATRNAFLTAVLHTSVSAIVALDAEGGIVYANDEARRLLVLQPHAGRLRMEAVLETLDGRPLPEADMPSALVRATGAPLHDLRYAIRRPDGQFGILSIHAAPLPQAADEARIVISVTDITHAEASAERLRRQAAEDPLTGLANRRALADAVEARLKEAAPFALVMLDLDNFKAVNDLRRHDTGDAVLRVAADRLRAVAGADCLVARMGGDEFMVLAPGADAASAPRLAEALRAAISAPIEVGRQPVHLGASVGIALHPEHGTSMALLMTGADIALHAAKRAGRNRSVLLSQEQFAAEARRSAITQALASTAVEADLRLVFQPQFRACGAFDGAEALLRWRDPRLGEIGPAEFIPIAEETGLIQRIDARVAVLAARQLGLWARRGWRHRLAVNASAQTFARAGFAEELLQHLADEEVCPQQLVVELTETSLATLSSVADHNIATLRRAGVGIAIDDFGTGYASLSYLHRIEATEIKIDRGFVAGLETAERRDSKPLIQAILGIAQALGLAVTAEGVETERQRCWLSAEGCDRLQGYLLGRPLPVDAFEAAFVTPSAGPG